MPWFLTPHGPHFVVEPGTIDEYERRDYVVMTAQQVTDYYAGVAFPDPPSFATEAEVLPIVTAAVQSGAGALPAALRTAFGSFVPITRFGAGTGKTAAQNATAIQSAIDSGEPLFVPPGVFTTNPLTVEGPITILGAGRQTSTLKNPGGSVLLASGSGSAVQHLTLWSDGGGATVEQTGPIDGATWDHFGLIQNAADQSMWDNNGHDYVDMSMRDFGTQHTQDAAVASWKLVSVGGTINANLWSRGRSTYSGEYHFLVEATGANANYSNTWEHITFEVCTGGGIRLVGVRDYLIDNCSNWDMQVGTPNTGQRHFYSADRNASLINCKGTLRRLQRLAGTNAPGVYDVHLPGFGAGAGTVIEFCRNVSSGDPFTIDDQSNAIYFVDPESAGRTQLQDGSGAVSIDLLGLSIGGKKLRQGTAAPTAGTWARGDTVDNSAPSAGGFKGWVCVAGGTPGTWKTFGVITA